MTGYIETLTDPSYYGQIVTQTFPLLGNSGVITADMESPKCRLTAYVVREKCDYPSNFRCEMTLGQFLKEQDVPAVYGVDTRELTRIVREAGVMNAALTFRPLTDLSALNSYRVKDAVKTVSSHTVSEKGDKGGLKVVVYDFGAKGNIVRELVKRGCHVIEVPAETTAEEALAYEPDGIMLTNGPGDPAENTEVVANIRKLIGKKPIFGICLGHQLFALAMGGQTRKMKYGHRGANQPVKDLVTGKVFITSQNHGYEVVSDSCQRRHLRGRRLSLRARGDGAVPPRSVRRPARRQLSVRPLYCQHEKGERICRREVISRRCSSSVRDPLSSDRRRNLTMRVRRRAAS